MASYRFCRPDDIPRLVQAVNTCYLSHFPGLPEISVEDFRREIKELSVWPSNCMMAVAGDEPIAVLIGTKREHEVLVLRIGARADHQRQGHCQHMLTSLSQKLAVLGPPRLVAEVPGDLPAATALAQAASYSFELSYHDYLCPAAAAEPVPEDLVCPIGVADLVEAGALRASRGVAWERSLESLELGEEALEGLAVVSPERVEAYLLYRRAVEHSGLDVVALHVHTTERLELLASLLIRALAARTGRSLRLPRLLDGEIPEQVLNRLGFVRQRRIDRYAATATPA